MAKRPPAKNRAAFVNRAGAVSTFKAMGAAGFAYLWVKQTTRMVGRVKVLNRVPMYPKVETMEEAVRLAI